MIQARRRRLSVKPRAVFEFNAARAALGSAPGINDPLTTQAFDTSGGGNHGTLTNFSGTPWQGEGTVADPYHLQFDPAASADYVALPNLQVGAGGDCAYEAWFKDDGASLNATRWIMAETGAGVIRLGIFILNSKLYSMTRDATQAVYTPGFGNVSSDGLWHHALGGVAGGFLKSFLDGVDRSVTPVAARPPATFTASQIGAGAGVETWNGGIAVARMYRLAPTLAMAQQNYNAGPL